MDSDDQVSLSDRDELLSSSGRTQFEKQPTFNGTDVELPATTPLSWGIKICYSLIGIVDVGPLIIGFYLTAFLLEVVQLHPASTGLLFLMGQLTDGTHYCFVENHSIFVKRVRNFDSDHWEDL
jgi:hypothetical protein